MMQPEDKRKWVVISGVLVIFGLGFLTYTIWSEKTNDGFTTSSTPLETDLKEGDAKAPTVAISPATARGQVLLSLDGNLITFEGLATGTMFFEASFPVQLQDQNGVVLAQGLAQAEGEWMTSEPVAFTATMTAVQPISPPLSATLILQKDNPSGLPENDLTVTFPALLEKI